MDLLKLFIGLIVCILTCEGKVFTRCKLAKELLSTRIIKKTFLGNWVCLIEQVSRRDTKAVTITPSGKKHYGLYQIPQKFCREAKRGGICNISCESLLADDITEGTVCANYIFEQEGFKFWSQWVTRCKNNDHVTIEIYKCPDLNSPRSSPELRESPERYVNPILRYRRRYRRNSKRRLVKTSRVKLA